MCNFYHNCKHYIYNVNLHFFFYINHLAQKKFRKVFIIAAAGCGHLPYPA